MAPAPGGAPRPRPAWSRPTQLRQAGGMRSTGRAPSSARCWPCPPARLDAACAAAGARSARRRSDPALPRSPGPPKPPCEPRWSARIEARLPGHPRSGRSSMLGWLGLAAALAPSSTGTEWLTYVSSRPRAPREPPRAFCGQELAKSDPPSPPACRRADRASWPVEDDRRALRVGQPRPTALLTLAAPSCRRCRPQAAVRLARLWRPDHPDPRAAASIRARPGCCSSSMAASTTCCSTRCRTPRPSNGRSRGADRGVLRRATAPRPTARAPHGLRGRRPQAVHLLLPGRRPGRVRPLARPDGQPRHRMSGSTFSVNAVLDVSFRSTPAGAVPGGCRVRRSAAAGGGVADGRGAASRGAPRGPGRQGRAVAAGSAAT